MSQDGIDSVVGKRCLFMCRIARLFLLQRLKGSMSGDARDFKFQQHRDASCHQVFFCLQGKAPKEIQAILTEILGEHAHRMPPSKTGWPCLNVVIFPPVLRLVLDDPKQ